MLRLPANVLVEEQASVLAYQERAKDDDVAAFDFRGIAWMGPRARDQHRFVRQRISRRAAHPAVAGALQLYRLRRECAARRRRARAAVGSLRSRGRGLQLVAMTWNRPISAKELVLASTVFSTGGADSTSVITGADFTDDAIEERDDLQNYRIVHFATHGLLAPPRPECPARPSLLTSFGEKIRRAADVQ
jgi:hypothetical protein